MVTDRIGDFVVRLQNAAMVSKREVVVPHSAYLLEIAKKLKQLGFLSSVETKEKDGSVKKSLVVELAFNERGQARVHGVKRISKPGRRLYAGHKDAHRVRGGVGARVLSTSAGVLSDSEARKAMVGGEDLFEIW